MHRTISTVAAFALLAASSPVLAAPTGKAAVRLTPIDDVFSGSACRVSLRRSGQAIVGGMDYFPVGNDNWQIGINGKTHRLHDQAGMSPNPMLVSKDRKVTVRLKRGKRVWESQEESYPAETHQTLATVTVAGKTAVFTVYMTCGDG